MSTQQLVSSIAEYKRCAILKYCKDNGIKKSHLDEFLISNNHNKLGIFYSFIGFFMSIKISTFKLNDCFFNIRDNTTYKKLNSLILILYTKIFLEKINQKV